MDLIDLLLWKGAILLLTQSIRIIVCSGWFMQNTVQFFLLLGGIYQICGDHKLPTDSRVAWLQLCPLFCLWPFPFHSPPYLRVLLCSWHWPQFGQKKGFSRIAKGRWKMGGDRRFSLQNTRTRSIAPVLTIISSGLLPQVNYWMPVYSLHGFLLFLSNVTNHIKVFCVPLQDFSKMIRSIRLFPKMLLRLVPTMLSSGRC